jgi:uncharacterized protein (TIGR00255 family)
MRSMTGFGRGSGDAKTVRVAAEIKTVNHKFHDVSIKVPASYQFLEPEIRDLILSSVSRGKVDFFMKDLSPVRSKTVEVNEELLREYLRAAKKAAAHFKLKSDLSMENLLRMPDVLMVVEVERQEAEQRQAVLEAVRQSLKALDKMRQAEGARLGKDMQERAKEITGVVQMIRQRHKVVLTEKIKIFKEKVAEFLPEPLQDQPRLATEEALLLQRHDISEELTRLDSHLEALQQSLKEKESVGRKLDFLIQEMNRETNTIGSKSTDSKMTQGVVRLKELLEQLREQIQNIE